MAIVIYLCQDMGGGYVVCTLNCPDIFSYIHNGVLGGSI